MPQNIFSGRRIGLLFTCLFFGLMTASATSIRPPSFEQLVDGSGRIVRATVSSVRPYEDSYEGKRVVRTEIVLNVLENIRGEGTSGELKIRHLGGEVNGLRMEVGAMPKFEVGKEMVLFLHGEGRFICPTVGWGHGQYGVDRSGVDGIARIRRSNGSMLSNLKQVAESFHEERLTQQSNTPVISGMSLQNFKLSVLDRVENGKNQR